MRTHMARSHGRSLSLAESMQYKYSLNAINVLPRKTKKKQQLKRMHLRYSMRERLKK
jgi:hypothetical protein